MFARTPGLFPFFKRCHEIFNLHITDGQKGSMFNVSSESTTNSERPLPREANAAIISSSITMIFLDVTFAQYYV